MACWSGIAHLLQQARQQEQANNVSYQGNVMRLPDLLPN
jgi:hypothetical protein